MRSRFYRSKQIHEAPIRDAKSRFGLAAEASRLVVRSSYCKASPEFQRVAFLAMGLWVRHECEAASTDREAARLWGDTVATAANNGKDGER